MTIWASGRAHYGPSEISEDIKLIAIRDLIAVYQIAEGARRAPV